MRDEAGNVGVFHKKYHIPPGMRGDPMLGRAVWDMIVTAVAQQGQFLFEGSWNEFEIEVMEHGPIKH